MNRSKRWRAFEVTGFIIQQVYYYCANILNLLCFQIAASYGNIICVFEPVEVSPQGKPQKVSFFWTKCAPFYVAFNAQDFPEAEIVGSIPSD